MKNRKPFLIALGFAVCATVLGSIYFKRFEREMSGGEKIAVLSVMKDLAAGTTIKGSEISVREIPIAYVDERMVLAKDQSKVIGIDTVLPLRNQQTLQWTDLAVREDVRNLSGLVSAGKRAVTVRANRSEAAGYKMIRPGDYVDVIATLDNEQGNKTSLVLLQKILVVAVGLRTDRNLEAEEGSSSSSRNDILTLSLDVEEAQLLSLAVEQGTLSVAVRNPDDPITYEDLPDMDASAIIQARDNIRARKRTSSASASTPNRPVKITAAP